jgi:hypothetical protein
MEQGLEHLAVDQVGLFRTAGGVGARIQPYLHDVGYENAITAHGAAEHGFSRCRDSDVDVGGRPGRLQRKAKSFEDVGLESFNEDDRCDAAYEPKTERVGGREETQAQS